MPHWDSHSSAQIHTVLQRVIKNSNTLTLIILSQVQTQKEGITLFYFIYFTTFILCLSVHGNVSRHYQVWMPWLQLYMRAGQAIY